MKDEIAELLPHGESMCLLDGVCEYGPDFLMAESHQPLTANPLLIDGVFYPELCIEYAAQAAAVHLRLAEIDVFKPSIAYVTGVKNFTVLQNLSIDNSKKLEFSVKLNIATTSACSYDFECFVNGEVWTHGSLSIMSP